jgi:nitroreductase
MWKKTIFELIRTRTSWRTYDPKPLSRGVKNEILEILEMKNVSSPFGGEAHFKLFELEGINPSERKKYGTYGMIKGAIRFIWGIAKKSDHNWENFGYLLEYIILKATELELGTCWLGGTFSRKNFASKLDIQKGDIFPAMTTLGYPARRRVKEKIIRTAIKAKKRKAWETIFFENDLSTPMNKHLLGDYSDILEMVRIGPSASNKQPWRIIKEKNENIFHIYTITTAVKQIEYIYDNLRRLDAGIAVCHFDLCLKEKKIKGNWIIQNPHIDKTDHLNYKITWKA